MKVVHLIRKPLSEGSVVRNVLKHGTGALNIEASRIPTEDDLWGGAYAKNPPDRWDGTENWRFKRGDKGTHGEFVQPTGRFPANAVLEHRPGCREGTCVEGCPIRVLDVEVGILTSGQPAGMRGNAKQIVAYNNSTGAMPVTGFGDSGGPSRFFIHISQEEGMDNTMPQELRDYLRGMISPDHLPNCVFIYADHPGEVDWAAYADESVHAVVLQSPPDGDPGPWMDEIWRVMKPGAHIMLAAPDAEPTGHTGAIRLEDRGFEIRDAILRVQEPGRFHYVPKPSRKERHFGTESLASKRDPVLLVFKDGLDEDELAAISEALEQVGVDPEIIDNLDENGIKPSLVPAGIRDFFTAREVDARYGNVHPCLHPDALVLTAGGYKPISHVVETDLVYAADGKFHEVEHVSRHRYTSPNLFCLSVAGTNLTTLASDNHPFLIWRPRRTKKGNVMGGSVEWVESKDIVKGDYTLTPVLAEPNLTPDTPTPPRATDTEFWFLFGLYLAEGVLQRAGHGNNVYPSYTLHEDEVDLHNRIAAYTSANTSIYEKPGRAVQVIAFDADLGEMFGNLGGTGAATKTMHTCVWSLSRVCREALLRGYLAGDGGRVRTHLQAKTVSPTLAGQMQLLAASVGYMSNLHRYEAEEGYIGDRKFKTTCPTYQLRLYDRNMRLADDTAARAPSRPTTVEHEGVTYYLRYVQSNTEVPYDGDVVNLSVKGCPTFQTAVGMSHNTVKPRDLMAKLLHDVPKDQGPVLDPFMGSGSAALSCMMTGHDYIGIEREEEYVEIADARVRYWDRAENAWIGADIKSEAPSANRVDEREELDFGDLLDL